MYLSRRVHDLRRLSRDFHNEFSQNHKVPTKIQFQIDPFRKQTSFFPSKKQVQPSCSVWDLFFLRLSHPFSKRKHIHLISAGFRSPKRIVGWYILQCSQIIKSAALRWAEFFSPPKFSSYRSCLGWLISCESPCDLGISRNSAPSLWLNWGGRGGGCLKRQKDDQENMPKGVTWWFVTTRTNAIFHGALEPWSHDGF